MQVGESYRAVVYRAVTTFGWRVWEKQQNSCFFVLFYALANN